MKYVASSVAVAFMLFAMSAFWGVFSSAHAQEVPPAPDVSLLTLSCDYATMRAGLESIHVRSCRRAAPDVIEEWKATITIKITSADGAFIIPVHFYKSPWWLYSWEPKPA